MNSEVLRRRIAVDETEYLAQALILATTEESRILARREHIWALTEYYESTLQALRDTVKEQHGVIHELAVK